MSLSFTNSAWDSRDFNFDRKAALRWSLQALEFAVGLPTLGALTKADLRWYIQHVEEIFQPHLPAPAPSGSNTCRTLITSQGFGLHLREED